MTTEPNVLILDIEQMTHALSAARRAREDYINTKRFLDGHESQGAKVWSDKTERRKWEDAVAAVQKAEGEVAALCTKILVNILGDEYEPRIVLYPGERNSDAAPILPEPKEGH